MRSTVVLTGLVLASSAGAETYVPMGTLEASCTQVGVAVELDGQPWFACPGTQSKEVSAGPHTVVGDRSGHLPSRQNPFVPENGRAHIDIAVVALDRPVTVQHRFPRWLPWSVAGGGLLVGAGGVLLMVSAANRMNEYDEGVASMCAATGCDTQELDRLGLTDIRESAEFRNKLGFGMTVGGVAVVATGVVLLLINKPVRQVPSMAVVPGHGGGLASAAWRF